ncbi:thialysine N-epsilon-acetyltransferase-like isoform X2 [Lithobates pipiens]
MGVMARYRVRAAEPGDCEEIMQMIQDLAEYEKMSDRVINTAEGPRLVGYALSHYIYNTFKGRALYLEDLFVMPQYRGKGIGSKLLTATAELCLSLGCARLQLSVLDWNQSAISFYQSRGGRNMSEEEGWRMIWFFPDDLQRMVSKNAEQAGGPGLL